MIVINELMLYKDLKDLKIIYEVFFLNGFKNSYYIIFNNGMTV